MLSKDQALAVADQFISDAQRRRDQVNMQRLVSVDGPIPHGLTPDQFEEYVHEAEAGVLRNWIFWTAVATWSALALTLFYIKSTALLVSYFPLGMLLIRFIRRKLITGKVGRRSAPSGDPQQRTGSDEAPDR